MRKIQWSDLPEQEKAMVYDAIEKVLSLPEDVGAKEVDEARRDAAELTQGVENSPGLAELTIRESRQLHRALKEAAGHAHRRLYATIEEQRSLLRARDLAAALRDRLEHETEGPEA